MGRRVLLFPIAVVLLVAQSVAWSDELDYPHACNNAGVQPTHEIEGWDGESKRQHGETVYSFGIRCDGTYRHITEIFISGADANRYKLQGGTLLKHTKDDSQRVLARAEECRTVYESDYCERSQDEIMRLCRQSGLSNDPNVCWLEYNSYRCDKPVQKCEPARYETRYVPVWEPFATGYAPLPPGARIVKTSSASASEPAQSAVQPQRAAAQQSVSQPGPWSRAFGGVPLLVGLLFIPCALYYGVARIGDFDNSVEQSGRRLLAVGASLLAVWLAALSGKDGLVLLCLFFLFPATAIWLASADFMNFCQGFVFLRVRPPAGGLSETDEQSLRRDLAETRDAIQGYRGRSAFWHRVHERAYTEALKSSSDRQRTRSDYLRTTTETMRDSSELFDETTRLSTKSRLKREYEETETAEQTAELAGRLADAERELAQKRTGALEARNTLEAVETFKEDKMELGRARYQGRIAQAKSDSAYAQADQHNSEQARDKVRNADNAEKEKPSEVDEVDSWMAAQQDAAMSSGDTEKAMFWAAERTKRRKPKADETEEAG